MTREETLSRLRSLEAALRGKGVRALYLFGSVARGEAGPGSDIDLFFDYDPANRMSYFSVIGIEQFLENELRTRIDLIPRDSLHRLARDEIVSTAQQVY